MTKFLLGEGAECDLGSLVDTRLLIQGNSGAGKSFLVRRILEQTFGKVQHLVIDPEGEFSTLREKFDYVLAAPSGGDTVAHPRSAALLCERLLECRASAVLDIFELKPADRVLFVKNFLEALIDAPKRLWHPAIVVVDESQRFCPERGTGEAESSDAMQRVATQGRKRGFCLVPAVQRLSMFHKSVAAECNNKLIGRTTLDDDVKRAAKELGLPAKEALEMLRSLDPRKGEWYAYGPSLSQEPRRISVGPVATTHPKAGARAAFNPPPPSAAVLALLPQLADLPAEAESRAKTVDDLRRELADVRRKLTIAEKSAPKPQVERIEVNVLPPNERAAVMAFTQRLGEVAATLNKSLALAASPGPPKIGTYVVNFNHGMAAPESLPRPPIHVPRERKQSASPDGEGLTGPEQRILDSLAWFASIGVGAVENSAAAFGAGYTVNGSYFNARGRLNAKGFVTYLGNDTLALTDEGRKLASFPDEPASNAALHELVMSKLPGPLQRVLRPLLSHWPEVVANDQLAEAAGYTLNGSYFNARGRLKSFGLIEYVGGNVRARDILFPVSR